MAAHCGATYSLFVTSSEMLRGSNGPGPDFSYIMFTISLLIIIKSLNITYLLPSSGGSMTVWTRQHIIFSFVFKLEEPPLQFDTSFLVKNIFYLMYIILFSLPLTLRRLMSYIYIYIYIYIWSTHS